MDFVPTLVENGPALFQALGAVIAGLILLVGAASVVAKLTPTTKDDAIIDAILGVLNALALNPKESDARTDTTEE